MDEQELRSAFRITFESEAGQKVLADLIRNFHVVDTSHVMGCTDGTAFNEGERNVVNHILQMCRTNWEKPQEYVKQVTNVGFGTERP